MLPFPAYAGDGSYVFVCYSHEDAEVVYPEMTWLRENGVNIWYDEGVRPAHEFPEELALAIDGAERVLFYVSPRSVDAWWCRNEIYYALEHEVSVVASHLEATEMPSGLALATGAIQALIRHELKRDDYRRKLLSVLTEAALPETMPARRSLWPLPQRWARAALRVAILAGVSALGVAGYAFWEYQQQVLWAKSEALPEIERMIEGSWRDYTDAYALAMEAERYIPDDPQLAELVARSSLRMDVGSEPPGASVYVKKYSEPGSEWDQLGVTPIEGRRVPMGIFRWKFEKPGYDPVLAAAPSWEIGSRELLLPAHLSRILDEVGTIPAGMVRVTGAETPTGTYPDFFIDRFEVTNAEFKAFIDAGGYRNPDWWTQRFVDDGRTLSFEEAMARFVDTTGRPGPATWRAGDYIEGTERHPVTGISWYEAQAYATFRGRELPTEQHWGLARGEYTSLVQWPQLGGYAILVPFSNFGTHGPVPVGSLPGITAYGVHDMAGNVREWCWNETPSGRLIRGGAWDDVLYRFVEPAQAPPFDRSEKNGFRTVAYLERDAVPAAAFEPLEFKLPVDPATLTPVADEVFEIYREHFAYAADAPLNAVVESRAPSLDGIHEQITLDAAYGNKRLILHLFLPTHAMPPYQTVIYFPGDPAFNQTSSENLTSYFEFSTFLSFLLKNGRAVVFPVYEGTFERSGEVPDFYFLIQGGDPYRWSAWVVDVVKDFRRTIDYLESREEIDDDKLAYYGMSTGAYFAAIIPAVEKRIKVNVVLAGGLDLLWSPPEVNQINYVGRVTQPTLMMNGRYDTVWNIDRSIKPMFNLLGTPEADKVLRLYDTDHIPPMNDFIRDSLDWLDRYLGPVTEASAR